MRPRWLMLVAAWCLGQPALAQEFEPGTRGYGESVFSGSQIERFEVEILGSVQGWGSTGRVILAKLSGGPLEHTGVLQGMSGSPVWVDGELIGAVMSTWAFAKDAIAGIRPIEEMRALGEYLDAGAHPTWRPGDLRVAAPSEGGDDGISSALESLLGDGKAPPTLEAAAGAGLVWTASGFHPDLLPSVQRTLGVELAPGGALGGAAPGSFDASGTLRPGEAMAALLVDGDARLAAVGTVTETRGSTVLGFGHPFLGIGPVSVPMARARVVALLPSRQISFKIAEPTATVGALLVDRRAGVSGKLGVRADTLPLRVHIDAPGGERDFAFELARVPSLLPDLAAWGVMNAVLYAGELATESSAELGVSLHLAGEAPLESRAALSGSGVPAGLGEEVRLPLLLALSTVDRSLRVERVEASLKITTQVRAARLGRVMARPPQVQPGDEVTVRVEVIGFRREPQWHELKLVVPPHVTEGPLLLNVGDGASAFRDEISRSTERWRNLGIRQIREALAMRDPASLLVATLYSRSASAVVRGVELERLPGSVRSVLRQSTGTSSGEEVAATRVDRAAVATSWVLQGSKQITLPLVSEVEKK